jgi:hypothetical protein
LDTADHHLGAAAIVPPLGFGLTFLLPSLVVCLVCLSGVLLLSAAARGRRRRLMAPAMYSLLSLAVILAALAVRSVLA